jgi:transposase
VLEGIAWIARTGSPWRDLPERFGKWNTVWRRFARWRDVGVFECILEALVASGAGGAALQMIDSTVIRAHHRSAGAKKRSSQSNALGRSRGDFSTKIHVLTDAHGLPIVVHLTPGQTADISAASALLALARQRPHELLADKGYDSDDLRTELSLQGAHPIIPWKPNRKQRGALDRVRYAKRNRIERMMGLLKQFRRVATCYGKTPASFLSFIQVAAI